MDRDVEAAAEELALALDAGVGIDLPGLLEYELIMSKAADQAA